MSFKKIKKKEDFQIDQDAAMMFHTELQQLVAKYEGFGIKAIFNTTPPQVNVDVYADKKSKAYKAWKANIDEQRKQQAETAKKQLEEKKK